MIDQTIVELLFCRTVTSLPLFCGLLPRVKEFHLTQGPRCLTAADHGKVAGKQETSRKNPRAWARQRLLTLLPASCS